MMLLVNFTGPPSAGKSTLTAGVFHQLKKMGVDCEMIIEYTKELHRRKDYWTLSDELLVFSEKYRRIKQFEDVDVVLTDSPLHCSIFYGKDQFNGQGTAFFEYISNNSFDSIFFILPARDTYDTRGRTADPSYAKTAGDAITSYVQQSPYDIWDIPTNTVDVESFCVDIILQQMEKSK